MKNLNTPATPPLFALIDGNSFYASCQIAFNPALKHRPVVVLSNNDGCIVAANDLAKSLNTELLAQSHSLGTGGYHSATPKNMMFQPYFKVKWILDKYNAAVFSSNYELYGDMSNRMHQIVGGFSPHQEIYSIDESFLDLSGFSHLNLTDYAKSIQQKVAKHIGIPVAVGIAPSKTLAKLANHLAKKNPQFKGILDYASLTPNTQNNLLNQVKVGHIWGIGKRLAHQLQQNNIFTALDLKQSHPAVMRQKMGVVMERTIRELNGESCLALETVPTLKKQILSSRSFRQGITEYADLETAIVHYTVRAAEKLRQQNSLCNLLTLSIQTSPFKKETPFYTNSQSSGLITPTDNSILLIKQAKQALKSIWKPGLNYQKASIMLSEIVPKDAIQQDLFERDIHSKNNPKQTKLMTLMDQLNAKHGQKSLFLGAMGNHKNNHWQTGRQRMSPRYTTRWNELLVIK